MLRITNLKIRFRFKEFSWVQYKLLQNELLAQNKHFNTYGNFFVTKIKKPGHDGLTTKSNHGDRRRRRRRRRPQNQDKYLTVSCFYNGWINVTGISSISDIKPSCALLAALFFEKNPRLFLSYAGKFNLDNISAVGRETKIISNFFKIIHNRDRIISDLSSFILDISYNNQRFPGIIIKTVMGTCILYKTGNYVAVGVRKISHLKNIALFVQHVSLHAQRQQ